MTLVTRLCFEPTMPPAGIDADELPRVLAIFQMMLLIRADAPRQRRHDYAPRQRQRLFCAPLPSFYLLLLML